jgi:chaperonin GroEL
VKAQDLGQARRAWADDEFFGVAGGKGAPRSVRAHVSKLRMALENVEDQEARKKIRERLGKLLGGTAILRVGGMGDIAIRTRKELAERTIAALRTAIGKGALPGGGVALLACRSTLRRMADHAEDLDERMAFRILSRALEEPARTILRNAGYDPSPLMDQIDRAGAGCGLDVRSGCIVDMARAGIVDSAGVLNAAAHEAVASAALALTIDVLVHKQRPEMSFEP